MGEFHIEVVVAAGQVGVENVKVARLLDAVPVKKRGIGVSSWCGEWGIWPVAPESSTHRMDLS